MTLKRLGVTVLLLVFVLLACAPVVSNDAPGLRVQCMYKGELVFNQTFDHASIVNGSIIVWVGPESVTIEPAIGETCWIEKAER